MKLSTYTANQPLMLGGQIYMWNRYLQCQYVVHMMTAQFTKFGHQSRIDLRDAHGQDIRWVVPLKDRSFRPIQEVELVEAPHTLETRLMKTLQAVYAKAPHFKQVRDLLCSAASESHTLGHLNLQVHKSISKYLGCTAVDILDYQLLPGGRPDHPSQWVADMGRAINCTTYIGGGTAKAAYIQEEHWNGLNYQEQAFILRPYKRTKTDTTPPNPQASIVDMLMYLQVEEVHDLLG